MKIYASPVEWTEPDYAHYNYEAEAIREEQHKEATRAELIKLGYTGKNSGRIVRFGVADGYASYMIAEAGRKFALIHLPYGDAYQYPDAQYLPKAEILRRADREDSIAKLFAKSA